MSEIFSPGSVAGPQGPMGAAGSASAVSALAGALIPGFVGRNLFDYTQVVNNMLVQSDGTLAANASFDTSGLIFCPGATSMVCNIPIDTDTTFATYDANGTFIAALPSNTWSANTPGPDDIAAYVAFPLPGTQTFVRFDWIRRWGGSNYPADATGAMVYAVKTGTATLPGSYQPFGFDTPGSVNAKDSAVAANAAAALSSALTKVPQCFSAATTSGPAWNLRNVFDYLDYVSGDIDGATGNVLPGAGWHVATAYVPNATSFISNIAMRIDSSSAVCTYDAFGNFIADISASLLAYSGAPPNYLLPNVMCPLPGNQTYIKFKYRPDIAFGSYSRILSPASAVLYAGTVSAPPPSTLTLTNMGVPFANNAPVNIKTATQLGATPDLSYDVTATLNAFLATASATNPIRLILDGMFYTTGLVISPSGYTTIEGIGPGSGIILTAGTTQDAIRIGAYTAATGNSEGAYNIAAPLRTATNIVLRDFTINGAGQANAAANQPVTGAIAHGTYGVILTSCTNVIIDNLYFPTFCANYCITLSNVDHVRVTNCRFDTGVGFVRDGIHIDGPSEDIGIDNCDFATGDDAIALNAPEGYGGDISRVTVTNCRFKGSLTIMRIYTSIDAAHMPTNNVHRVRQVLMSNCSGSSTSMCFDLGITNGINPTTDAEQLVDFSVNNCSFTSPLGLACLITPMGSLNFTNVVYAPTSTTPVIWGNISSIVRLLIDGLVIRRDSDANAAPTSIVGTGGGTLGTVVLRNIAVVDTPGSSYSAVGALVSTAVPIGVLDLDGIDMTHIAALVDSNGYGNVTKMRGNGVIGTATQVPDSVMDSNTLYLSSNASGAASIKVGGTAKRLTLT